MKIKRTYFLTETGEPIGSVSGEFPSFLKNDVLRSLEEGARSTANGRPYHYIDGEAMSCSKMEKIANSKRKKRLREFEDEERAKDGTFSDDGGMMSAT